MIYCTNCGTPRKPGNQFCTGCGGQVSATASAFSRLRGRLVAALALVLVGGGVAAWMVLTHATDSPASLRDVTSPGQPQATAAVPDPRDPAQAAPVSSKIASASPSCESGSSTDADNRTVTYEAGKAIDGLPDTAWRCPGDGVGQRLMISFQGKVTLTSIGIVPGYAKTDPTDRADRYLQNRRISAVSYTFDDGSTFPQSFDTDARNRSVQTISLPNVSTSHVIITILSSVVGEAAGNHLARDHIAISEVTVSVR